LHLIAVIEEEMANLVLIFFGFGAQLINKERR
jgi:hypothetical protein